MKLFSFVIAWIVMDSLKVTWDQWQWWAIAFAILVAA